PDAAEGECDVAEVLARVGPVEGAPRRLLGRTRCRLRAGVGLDGRPAQRAHRAERRDLLDELPPRLLAVSPVVWHSMAPSGPILMRPASSRSRSPPGSVTTAGRLRARSGRRGR